jgi:hypothetical protein
MSTSAASSTRSGPRDKPAPRPRIRGGDPHQQRTRPVNRHPQLVHRFQIKVCPSSQIGSDRANRREHHALRHRMEIHGAGCCNLSSGLAIIVSTFTIATVAC